MPSLSAVAVAAKMEASPIYRLTQDTIHQIFSSLPLREVMICRSVCKFFNQLLTSPCFLEIISTRPPLNLLALRPPHHHHSHRRDGHSENLRPFIHIYDPAQNQWFRFSLDFLPFRSPLPVASSSGLIYVWGDSLDSADSSKSLVACNPLTRRFKVLPQLGSAWSRHGSVLVDPVNRVMVLTELAALYYSGTLVANQWMKFSSNLPSKPRSPVLLSNSVFVLCDVGSPWRSQWKLFSCELTNFAITHTNWVCLEKHEWGDIFGIIKRPRLLRGNGDSRLLMIGGLRSTFSLNPSCSTILILRLELERLEWEEAGRMPLDMYRCFQECSEFKVFGGGDRVYFSAKRMGKLAMWDCSEGWRWIDGAVGYSDGLCRGFFFDAKLTSVP
ncbi:PREDICTED: SKP1-interacting partner 15 [Tarenaya hassleriana]|uniref:SKP1-interacting partner 15 n=1 Tax=Tarenaya hassleriana TaxID=28532 RepID=UPI00053C6926|nr:PREDICTED: SKP1-interacting partner 15 [Tarenaya hassleriana]XP_010539729.1 PREDICTED: SKP1-interacting partner 15 [Tarenaya hassleriana]